jgi:hypothetical protein
MYFRVKATGSAFASLNFLLDIPARPSAPSGYTIDYINERTVEPVNTTITWSTSSAYLNPVSGTNAVVAVTPGQDLYFWVKATSGVFNSSTYRLVVPNRPAAPSITINYTSEVTSSISSAQEWSTSASMAITVTGTNAGIAVTPGTDLYIRTKATAGTFKSSIQNLDVPNRPANPSYQINYATERTTQVVPATDEYSVNSDMSSASSGTGVALSLTPGTDVYFRKKASASSFISGIQHLTVGLRPASPEFHIDYEKVATLETVGNTIEYAATADMLSAATGTGVAIALTPGHDLYFRVKATGSSFASLSFLLTVPAGPILEYTGNDTVTSATITMRALLDESMTGFDLTDLSVTNGTAQNIRENNTFDVIAEVRGDVTVRILCNSFVGASFPSNEIVVFYNKAVTGIPGFEKDYLIVYPNPNKNGILHIRTKQNVPYSISVYSMDGGLLKTIEMMEGENQQIDLHDLTKGIYYLKIHANDSVYIEKVILE